MTMPLYYQDENVTIYHGDSRVILPLLSGFDFLLTDPPYGIAYDSAEKKHGKDLSRSGMGSRTDVAHDDEPFDARHLAALSVPSIIWGANCFASTLPDKHGWLTWLKTFENAVASPDRPKGVKLRKADMELAWTSFVRRPQAYIMPWIGLPFDDEDGRNMSPEYRYVCGTTTHPTKKPVELMKWCLSLAPKECRVVLDPYLGSGSTLVAATRIEGWKGVGIELEEKYCEMSALRCKAFLGADRTPRDTTKEKKNSNQPGLFN